jgi:hypothetical protein
MKLCSFYPCNRRRNLSKKTFLQSTHCNCLLQRKRHKIQLLDFSIICDIFRNMGVTKSRKQVDVLCLLKTATVRFRWNASFFNIFLYKKIVYSHMIHSVKVKRKRLAYKYLFACVCLHIWIRISDALTYTYSIEITLPVIYMSSQRKNIARNHNILWRIDI